MSSINFIVIYDFLLKGEWVQVHDCFTDKETLDSFITASKTIGENVSKNFKIFSVLPEGSSQEASERDQLAKEVETLKQKEEMHFRTIAELNKQSNRQYKEIETLKGYLRDKHTELLDSKKVIIEQGDTIEELRARLKSIYDALKDFPIEMGIALVDEGNYKAILEELKGEDEK